MAESAFYAGDIEGQIKGLSGQIGTLNSNLAKFIQRRTATGTVTISANGLADIDFTLDKAFSNGANTYILINMGSSSMIPIALRSWTDTTHLNVRVAQNGSALSSVSYSFFVIGFNAQTT